MMKIEGETATEFMEILLQSCYPTPRRRGAHAGNCLHFCLKEHLRESYTRGLDLHTCHTSEDALLNHTMQHVCDMTFWKVSTVSSSVPWFSPENPCLLISKTLTAQGTQRAFWGLPQEFSSTKVLEIFSYRLRGPSSDSRGFKATKHDLIMMSLLDWSAKAPRFHCFLFGRKGA